MDIRTEYLDGMVFDFAIRPADDPDPFVKFVDCPACGKLALCRQETTDHIKRTCLDCGDVRISSPIPEKSK